MSVVSVPGVGDVVVVIEEQDFYQGGYKLRSLESAHPVGGGSLTPEQRAAVSDYLKKSGRINQ